MNCTFCGKEISKKGKTHLLFCKKNPERKDRSGPKNPMFGKIGSNRFEKARKNGRVCEVSEDTKNKIRKNATGRVLSVEEKEKISKSMRKYFTDNPDKVPYRIYHSSKESYAEKTFRILLEKNGIEGWIQEYPVSIYQMDFAFIKNKIDVEIDGNTHLLENVKKIDDRRDLYMESIGWRVIRFKASDLKKDPYKILEILKKELE